jgi:hypothetical protein
MIGGALALALARTLLAAPPGLAVYGRADLALMPLASQNRIVTS